ncbi:MAG: hypothetical protein K2X65_03945, partial [Burkholderiaceae bacterium]|nr:hypothetical protein [Burkholderiaceae bacterium]
LLIKQPSLDGFCPISDAVDKLALESGAHERGAVYTKREVVEFMLDLAGYQSNQPLHHMRLLEPSFGGGEFLLAAINRLMSHCGRSCKAVEKTSNSPPRTQCAGCSRITSLGLRRHPCRLKTRHLAQDGAGRLQQRPRQRRA